MKTSTIEASETFNLVRDGYERYTDVSLFLQILKQRFQTFKFPITKTTHINKTIGIDIIEIIIQKKTIQH